jgi:hypothetical protein
VSVSTGRGLVWLHCAAWLPACKCRLPARPPARLPSPPAHCCRAERARCSPARDACRLALSVPPTSSHDQHEQPGGRAAEELSTEQQAAQVNIDISNKQPYSRRQQHRDWRASHDFEPGNEPGYVGYQEGSTEVVVPETAMDSQESDEGGSELGGGMGSGQLDLDLDMEELYNMGEQRSVIDSRDITELTGG